VKSIRYLAEARAEFLHEIQYFARFSPRVAGSFDLAVQQAEAQIAEFPEMGSPYRHGTRRVLLPGRFKFALVYAVVADEVVIVAVAPFRRRPGYWKARVPT
jgi:toxin ParE1/3/4